MNTGKNWKRYVLLSGLAAGMMFSFSARAGSSQFAQVRVANVANVRSYGNAPAEKRLVKIDGRGEVTVSPDSLRARISVTTRAATLDAARTEAATKTQDIVLALDRLGIQALKVRTASIDVEPIKENEHEGASAGTTAPAIIGYQVTSTLSVALTNVSVQELRVHGAMIMNTALASGANDIGNVSFFLSNPREARRLALAAAVDDAKKNALAIATRAGIPLVSLDSITGERSFSNGYAAAQAVFSGGVGEGAPGAQPFPIEPGEIVVDAEIQASFQF